jgi:uroporphyrinogen decarboxylase
MALSYRENYLRNAAFQNPEFIPMQLHISNASWDQGRDEMEDVVAKHPDLWPDFEKGQRDWNEFDFGPGHREGDRFVDAWNCTWLSRVNGIEGVVVDWPLKEWSDFDTWSAPNPLETGDRGPVDWEQIRKDMADRREKGELCEGGLPHGFHFMRLYYLRGFDAMMMDVALQEPMLDRLVDVLDEHNQVHANQYLDMGVDVLGVGDDLGAQQSSVLGPDNFRRYCKPSYEKLFRPCRERGVHVMFHTDGYIMDLADDLIEAGVTILNPQDLCNGLDNIERELKGRVCIRLDVDRQTIVPYGTPQEIHELVEEEVRRLGSPEGGLELIAGIYPPTPPENVDALACAFEKFRTYWFDGHA